MLTNATFLTTFRHYKIDLYLHSKYSQPFNKKITIYHDVTFKVYLSGRGRFSVCQSTPSTRRTTSMADYTINRPPHSSLSPDPDIQNGILDTVFGPACQADQRACYASFRRSILLFKISMSIQV
jgi:hypothetical protein